MIWKKNIAELLCYFLLVQMVFSRKFIVFEVIKQNVMTLKCTALNISWSGFFTMVWWSHDTELYLGMVKVFFMTTFILHATTTAPPPHVSKYKLSAKWPHQNCMTENLSLCDT
jgi:hypothetical protein